MVVCISVDVVIAIPLGRIGVMFLLVVSVGAVLMSVAVVCSSSPAGVVSTTVATATAAASASFVWAIVSFSVSIVGTGVALWSVCVVLLFSMFWSFGVVKVVVLIVVVVGWVRVCGVVRGDFCA